MMIIILVLTVGIGVISVLGFRQVRLDRRTEERVRGWRVRCQAAGAWVYEELHNDIWIALRFDELGDYRESPAIIDIRSAERWKTLPSWASERRSQIIDRLKLELKPPHYVFIEAAEAEPLDYRPGSAILSSGPMINRFPVI